MEELPHTHILAHPPEVKTLIGKSGNFGPLFHLADILFGELFHRALHIKTIIGFPQKGEIISETI